MPIWEWIEPIFWSSIVVVAGVDADEEHAPVGLADIA